MRPLREGREYALKPVGRLSRMVVGTCLSCLLLFGVAATAAAQTGGGQSSSEITPPPDRLQALTLIPEPPIPQAIRQPWTIYTVRQGDSLWNIAKAYGIDLATIEYANGLDQWSILQPGQKLRVPLHSGYLYQVQPDDTLSSIAAAKNVTTSALAAANGLDPNANLTVGSDLIIPKDPKVKLITPPPSTHAAARISTLAWAIAGAARALIGHPYAWGGFGPFVFDCSGLVMYVYRIVAGIHLPHGSRQQMHYGTPVPEWALQPGDLVFFNTDGPGASHVGIYIGGPDRDFVSAETPGLGVGVGSLNMAYWADHFVGARRLLRG